MTVFMLQNQEKNIFQLHCDAVVNNNNDNNNNNNNSNTFDFLQGLMIRDSDQF